MSTNYYEQTYIISPVLEDDEYDEIVSKYKELIEDNDGEIDEVDQWGIRKTDHEMDGKSSGYFVNTYFEAPAELIDTLERAQRIDDHIVRYMTLKYDAKMLRHRELQKNNAVPQIIDQKDEDDEDNDDD
jgi:small subunit ribosomal protein S6